MLTTVIIIFLNNVRLEYKSKHLWQICGRSFYIYDNLTHANVNSFVKRAWYNLFNLLSSVLKTEAGSLLNREIAPINQDYFYSNILLVGINQDFEKKKKIATYIRVDRLQGVKKLLWLGFIFFKKFLVWINILKARFGFIGTVL